MPPRAPSSGRLLAGTLPCFIAGLAFAQATPAAESCKEDIIVNGDRVEADYKTNNIQLKNIVISQCDVRVEAKRARANGLDFANSRWTFDGDVRIDVEKRGTLRSDQADVDFRNGQIAKATITGKPAAFEQNTEQKGVARGSAGEIVYDVGAGTVVFSRDALLSYSGNEWKGPEVTYNIREQAVQGQRVHLVISPNKTPKPDEAKPATETPPGESGTSAAQGGSPKAP